MTVLAERAFHAICVKDYSKPEDYRERAFPGRVERAADFFQRLRGKVEYEGKTVLDFGCGTGATSIYMASTGAETVLGVDISKSATDFARAKLASDYGELGDKVRFRAIREATDIGDERFDVIVVKDSFEHFSDPEGVVAGLVPRLAAGGGLVIGFSWLWKSPYGGHIRYMTKLPWAHLIFPESVIMKERARFAVTGQWDGAQTFAETTGGLNKMTYGRFLSIMRASGLEPIHLETNVRGGVFARVCTLLRRVPFLREYFTFSVYSIWRYKAGRGSAH